MFRFVCVRTFGYDRDASFHQIFQCASYFECLVESAFYLPVDDKAIHSFFCALIFQKSECHSCLEQCHGQNDNVSIFVLQKQSFQKLGTGETNYTILTFC